MDPVCTAAEHGTRKGMRQMKTVAKVKVFTGLSPAELETRINAFLTENGFSYRDVQFHYAIAYNGTCNTYSALIEYED